jgi:hypothetical protein
VRTVEFTNRSYTALYRNLTALKRPYVGDATVTDEWLNEYINIGQENTKNVLEKEMFPL